jgi:hypothetical protein
MMLSEKSDRENPLQDIPYKWESLWSPCRRCKQRFFQLFPTESQPADKVCFACFMELTFSDESQESPLGVE